MIPAYSRDAAKSSADKVRNRIGDGDPDIAIILGSGLGDLADEIENAVFQDFPNQQSSVTLGC